MRQCVNCLIEGFFSEILHELTVWPVLGIGQQDTFNPGIIQFRGYCDMRE